MKKKKSFEINFGTFLIILIVLDYDIFNGIVGCG